jgi:Family of unknown function (DUF5856)
MTKAADMIAILFLGRELAHREHLKVTGPGSFAKHKALNEFYLGIIDLADKFAEAYQGKNGIIDDIPLAENEFPGNINEVLRKQVEWIEANRDKVTDCRPLQNIIDEICSFYFEKLYLLDNLE